MTTSFAEHVLQEISSTCVDTKPTGIKATSMASPAVCFATFSSKQRHSANYRSTASLGLQNIKTVLEQSQRPYTQHAAGKRPL